MNKITIMNIRAQGTIEYLVILAVIVVISLVVVVMMANSTAPAQGISETQSKLYWQSQPISIIEAIADSEGNAVLTLKPQENVTVKSLVINDETIELPKKRIIAGNKQIFLINTNIFCGSGTQAIRVNSINYITDGGLLKSFSGDTELLIECHSNVTSETILTGDYVENNPPVVSFGNVPMFFREITIITCGEPSQFVGFSGSPFTISGFTATDDTEIKECRAVFGSGVYGTITSGFTSILVTFDESTLAFIPSSVAIVCEDKFGNVGWSDQNSPIIWKGQHNPSPC